LRSLSNRSTRSATNTGGEAPIAALGYCAAARSQADFRSGVGAQMCCSGPSTVSDSRSPARQTDAAGCGNAATNGQAERESACGLLLRRFDVEDVLPNLGQDFRSRNPSHSGLGIDFGVSLSFRTGNSTRRWFRCPRLGLRRGSHADADSMGCDHEQLATVVRRFRVHGDVGRQAAENHWYDLGMVTDFQRDDSPVP
jgi:hypothetical protein